MELLDVYDDRGNKTGKIIERGNSYEYLNDNSNKDY